MEFRFVYPQPVADLDRLLTDHMRACDRPWLRIVQIHVVRLEHQPPWVDRPLWMWKNDGYLRLTLYSIPGASEELIRQGSFLMYQNVGELELTAG